MMKLKLLFVFVCFCILSMKSVAQKERNVWEGTPPTSNQIITPENSEKNGWWISNVSVPQMVIYQAPESKNNGMCVLICPGGAYAGVAFKHEGREFAQWLNTLGITGVVLKYRMPNKHKEIPLDDVWQAMRYIRTSAKDLKIDPNKVGIAGFSAGGHLASTASTHFCTTGISTRPDFSILFYPVITMTLSTHGGSRTNLLGDNPPMTDIYTYSNETQVNTYTPPTILMLSDDDLVVSPQNSIEYYKSLKNNNIPATMYVFPEGGHGWGMNKDFKYNEQMLSLLKSWLLARK
ncbi:MAG: alpha/beta hydrolase [Bacteroidales bacterium]|nr:alpha/beta hydrolase [Bacteroidales bacterium]